MLQRVMIAVAIACGPRLLFADEPTTALDVTVQATILGLLDELRRETGVAIVFVSHDLGVIAELCEKVAVMYAGEVIETGTTANVFTAPRHPYTQGLLGSIPVRGAAGRLTAIPGQVPAPDQLPPGCRFAPRCAEAVPGRCDIAHPVLAAVSPDHLSRCVRSDELELCGIALPVRRSETSVPARDTASGPA
jgi:oligopeptide/dipeptide ABC transporter ATP-binding protein